jgi:hypothetical protein
MTLTVESRSTEEKPVPVSLRVPQVSRGIAWERVPASALTDCLSHGTALKMDR